MPTGQPPVAAPVWAIRSVPVPTRDGPERLDHASRRLLNDSSTDDPQPTPNRMPVTVDPAALPRR